MTEARLTHVNLWRKHTRDTFNVPRLEHRLGTRRVPDHLRRLGIGPGTDSKRRSSCVAGGRRDARDAGHRSRTADAYGTDELGTTADLIGWGHSVCACKRRE